jgi:Collagen triple helix repeat (20 copies)
MRLRSIAILASVLPIVLGLVLAPLASAGNSPRVTGGVIHACMKTKGKKSQRGTLRIVNSAKQCKKKKGEKALTWGLVGPTTAGPQGATGSQGPTGPNGATGTTGANGATGTNGTTGANGEAGTRGEKGEKGSAATLENQLEEVIDEQTKEIELLSGKVLTLTGELLDLENGLDTVKGTVTDLGNTLNNSVANLKTEVGGTINGLENEIGGLAGKLGLLEPLSGKVALLEGLEPLLAKVGDLEKLPGEVQTLTTAVGNVTPLIAKVASLEDLKLGSLTGKVEELEPLLAKVGTLEKLPGEVAKLAPLTGEVGLLKTTSAVLGEQVAGACTGLTATTARLESVGTSLNKLGNKLTTVKILGIPILELGENPSIPETKIEPKCK